MCSNNDNNNNNTYRLLTFSRVKTALRERRKAQSQRRSLALRATIQITQSITPLSLNKKHLKNVGPIRHCEPPHALILHCHSPGVATVARRLRIDVHDNDNNDNA